MDNVQQSQAPNIFDGPIIPVTIKIGAPIVISSLLSFAYLIVDTYFIALIDPSSSAPLSGTALTFPFFFIFSSLASSLALGLTTSTGRIIGEKNTTNYQHLGATGFLIAFAVGIPLIILCYLFGEPVLQMLAGKEMSQEAIGYGLSYLYTLVPGMFIMLITHVYGGILQGEGHTHVSAVAMMLMTLLNIIFCPILMWGLGMGVAGAGLATTIASAFAFLYTIQFMRKGKSAVPMTYKVRYYSWPMAKEIIKIGLPQLIIATSFSVVVIAYNKIIGDISENALNAWALVGRIDQLLLIPVMAIGGATIILASQNFGRNQIQRIKDICYTNSVLVILLGTIVAALYVYLSPWMFSKFTQINEVAELAVQQVRVLSFTTVFVCATMIATSCFQATNRQLPPVIIFVAKSVLTVALGAFLIYEMGMGINGVLISIAVGNVLFLPIALYWVTRHLKKVQFKPVI